MIVPTNGRIVLFQPGPYFQGRSLDANQKLAATVVHVYDDRKVNLTVFDSTGHPCSAQNVQLLQDDDKPAGDSWAEWMPFQKGQAAKTEALESKAAQ